MKIEIHYYRLWGGTEYREEHTIYWTIILDINLISIYKRNTKYKNGRESPMEYYVAFEGDNDTEDAHITKEEYYRLKLLLNKSNKFEAIQSENIWGNDINNLIGIDIN